MPPRGPGTALGVQEGGSALGLGRALLAVPMAGMARAHLPVQGGLLCVLRWRAACGSCSVTEAADAGAERAQRPGLGWGL